MPGAFDLLQAHSLWIAIPLALLPAALNLWWTHRLPTGDDTALPERHMALTQRVSAATTSCAIGIGIVAGWHALWIVPLQILALVCTTHRTRQRLFGETWPLHRYLLWRLRMFGGVWAYWVCLALTPALVVYTPHPLRWWAAAAAFVVLASWNRWYMRVLLFVLGATRLTRSDLDERFQHVFRRARVDAPEIWRVGCGGGTLMNALALPSLTGNGVLFFDLLLERLSVEEITAILAHEVAHLEHYTPRLRRLWLIGLGAIALLVLVGAMGDVWNDVPSWLPVLSIAAVVGGLALRAQRLRPKETEADLRAVDLCENPEALVSGLTHVYAANRIPRRWSARTEERATHPSLAKRIADIRRHAQTADPVAAPAAERVVVASPEPGRWALIEDDRLTFLWTGAGETAAAGDLVERAQRLERLLFTDLVELRLAAGRGGALALTAMDRHARRFSLAVHERDAADVEAALDRVDHLIAPSHPRSSRVRIGERLTAFVALMMSSAFGAFAAILVPALLVLRRPTRRLMIALSTALIGAASAFAVKADVSYAGMLVLAMLSALALWEARALHHDETTGDLTAWRWIEPVAFTLPVVVGVALIAVDTRNLFDLHVSVRDRAWFAASTMALAAFWWCSPAAHSRRIASYMAVVAAAAIVVGCPWFLVNVVRDDLVASMPVLEERTVSLEAGSKQTVDGWFDSVSLAPDGDTFLLSADAEDDEETEDEFQSRRQFLVGAASGWSRSLEAPQAVLVDANRVLAWERTANGGRLHVDDARTGRETWTLPIESEGIWSLQAAPDGRWRAVTRHGRKMTRIDGRVGSSDTRDTTWTIPVGEGYADARVGEGPFALGIVSTWRQLLIAEPHEEWRTTTRLVRASLENQTNIATSHLGVECPMSPIGVDTIVCVSFDGRWSRFWRFDPDSGRLSGAGQRYGRLWGLRQITGTLLAARAGVQSIFIDLDERASTTLLHSRGACSVNDVAVAAGTIAMACAGPDTTDVTFYRLPESVHQYAAVGDQRGAVHEVRAR